MEKYRQADEETGSRFSKAAEPFSKDGVSRREFLEVASAGVVVGALHAAFPPGNAGGEVKNGIPYRELGRTGEKVSLVGIGGYHLGKQSDPTESVAIIRKALDEGINFLDNCCPLHWIHGTQKSRDSSQNARHRRRTSLLVRYRADASQCHGRALRQFRTESFAGPRKGQCRSPGHETNGGPLHSGQ